MTGSDRWLHYPLAAQAPKGAPNILLVLTDDVGFGACSTFGGAIPTPNLNRVATKGLRYNAFHTTAMCSPTRAALLTGRNHHSVGFGAISNYSVDAPGYTSVLPKSAATIARLLRDAGYDMAMFGKNHNTPEWEAGPLGPYDRWPIGLGFNYFYGFNAAQTDQFTPALVENMNPVRPPRDPGYHLDRDLSDKASQWVRMQKAVRPNHPFFVYLAPGTMHEPHQAPADWLARFRGAFAQGWDIVREEVFARQQAMGVIPVHAVLTERPPYIPAWESLPADERDFYARQMEAAAAQLSHMDHQFGRLLETLEQGGWLDDTLIMFIQGDNGACQEYEFGNTNTDLYGIITETPAEMIPIRDLVGGPEYHGTYAPGWGWAMNAPLPESKQIASHLGGIRNGLVISWPNGIPARGEVRGQFGHVIDIAPTIFEIIGMEIPENVDGCRQQPIEGISLVYTFADATAPDRHTEQYFEMLGNRGLYQNGWMASTLPERPPFGETSGLDPSTYAWGLYDLTQDWSQSTDIASAHPQKLGVMQTRFEVIAEAKNLYPIANDQVARLNHNCRPKALTGDGPRSFPASAIRYRSSSFPELARGWSGRADIEILSPAANATIFALGSRFSGAEMVIREGVPIFTLNPTGRLQDEIILNGSQPLSIGRHSILVSFSLDRPSRGSMHIDGREVSSVLCDHFPSPMNPETFVGEPAIDASAVTKPTGCTLHAFVVTQGHRD